MACQVGSVFNIATDPVWNIGCTVMQKESGQTLSANTMNYFPDLASLPLLAAYLKASGATASDPILGSIDMYDGGTIFLDWTTASLEIIPEQQSCSGTTITATASDGNTYFISLNVTFVPPYEPKLRTGF
jgi:hypothetical protein